MIIHFDTRALAVAHLEFYGWRLLKNGNWVSKDRTCAASIPPIAGSEIVCIAYREVE